MYELRFNTLLAHPFEEKVDGKLRNLDWEMEGVKKKKKATKYIENVIAILIGLTQFYLLFIRTWKLGV